MMFILNREVASEQHFSHCICADENDSVVVQRNVENNKIVLGCLKNTKTHRTRGCVPSIFRNENRKPV